MDIAPYLKDASHFQGTAERILFPSDEKEIVDILKEAHQTKTPVTVSGAGTGLTGARVPQGGLVLSLEKMNRILDIHWDKQKMRGYTIVEPGVRLEELEEVLTAQNLFYPPNPGEKKAFLGGTVATNASGSRHLKYGATRSYVQRLRVVLAGGETLAIGRGDTKAHGRTLSVTCGNNREIRIPLPTYRMPNTKNSAGYYALEEMDALDLFVGSEGTLGVFTQIELIIRRKPEKVLSGIFFFPSEAGCFLFSRSAKTKLSPRALEFFDSSSCALLRAQYAEIPPDAGGAIYFEQECSHEDLDEGHIKWLELVKEFSSLSAHARISTEPADQKFFAELRHTLPVLVNERIAQNGFRKIGTDMAVPDEHAGDMFNLYVKELRRSGIDFVLFGHVGDNNLHANLMPKSQPQFDQALEIYKILADRAIAYGGTISAEHGIGKLRIPYLQKMFGVEALKEMARIKLALDPSALLGRGNIIPLEILDAVQKEMQ